MISNLYVEVENTSVSFQYNLHNIWKEIWTIFNVNSTPVMYSCAKKYPAIF